MINLDLRTARLIAVGASVAANCQVCLKTTAAQAGQDGIKETDIIEAIRIGKMVRHCAGSNMDEFASSISRVAAARLSPAGADADCGCAPGKNTKNGEAARSKRTGKSRNSGR